MANDSKYELDKDYAPLGIDDAEDGNGTTWPEFVSQVDKMDNQVAALTEVCDSKLQLTGEAVKFEVRVLNPDGLLLKAFLEDGSYRQVYFTRTKIGYQYVAANGDDVLMDYWLK